MNIWSFWNWLDNLLYPFVRLYHWLAKFVPFGRQMGNLSAAGTIAAVVLVSLLLFMIFVFGYQYWQAEDKTFWGRVGTTLWEQWLLWLLGLVAVVFAPIAVYWGIRLLSFSHPSPYPEIDAAWKLGVDALAKQNLEVADIPLILVLGTRNIQEFQSFHGADRGKGAAPFVKHGERDWLYWGSENDCLYLHLPQCCHLAQTDSVKAAVTHFHAGTAAAPAGGAFFDGSASWANQESFGGTSKIGGSEDSGMTNVVSGPLNHGGTSDPFADPSFDDDSASFAAESKETSVAPSFDLPQSDTADRLRYLFKLIRKAAPTSVSPHGVMVVVSKDAMADESRSRELAQRMERDLVQINRVAETHLPLTFLFSGFENDKGFVKLAMALTKLMPNASRFGVGTDRTEMPKLSDQNMDALIKRLLAYIDSHVYNVLGSESQLSKHLENRELFRFAYMIRSQFSNRLREVLKRALLSPELSDDPTYLLGGCYLCALPSRPNERPFYLDGTKQKVAQIFELADFSEGRRHWNRIQTVCGIGLILTSLAIWVAGIAFAASKLGWFGPPGT